VFIEAGMLAGFAREFVWQNVLEDINDTKVSGKVFRGEPKLPKLKLKKLATVYA